MNSFEIKANIRSKLDDYVATDGVIELSSIPLQAIVDDLMVIMERGLSDAVNSVPICECFSWARAGLATNEGYANHHTNCKISLKHITQKKES